MYCLGAFFTYRDLLILLGSWAKGTFEIAKDLTKAIAEAEQQQSEEREAPFLGGMPCCNYVASLSLKQNLSLKSCVCDLARNAVYEELCKCSNKGQALPSVVDYVRSGQTTSYLSLLTTDLASMVCAFFIH